MAVVLLLLVIWAVQHVQHTTAQPLPSPRLQTQSTGNVAFTVNAGGTYYYKFTVPAGALNVTLKGHFSATGGSGNDIQVIVVSEDEYVNLQNGHNAKSFYNSGQVTQGSPSLNLPNEATTYYAVFNNKFSFLTPKAVQANLTLSYYMR